jgi:hypothetical protein
MWKIILKFSLVPLGASLRKPDLHTQKGKVWWHAYTVDLAVPVERTECYSSLIFTASQTANCASKLYVNNCTLKMEPQSGLKAAAGTSVQGIFSLACYSSVIFNIWMESNTQG